MDAAGSGLDLRMYYIIGGVVILLLLLLVSFMLNSRRSARLEVIIEELTERLRQSEANLDDANKALDELFGKKRRGELNLDNTDAVNAAADAAAEAAMVAFKTATVSNAEGKALTIDEAVTDIYNRLNQLSTEQHESYEGIMRDQQGLSHSISQLKTLLSNLPSATTARAAQGMAAQNMSAQGMGSDAQRRGGRGGRGGAGHDNGMFMPPGMVDVTKTEGGQDTSFARTAADIAAMVSRTDFSQIDPNAAPATIGEHMRDSAGNAGYGDNRSMRRDGGFDDSFGSNGGYGNGGNGGYGNGGNGYGREQNGSSYHNRLNKMGSVSDRDPLDPLGMSNLGGGGSVGNAGSGYRIDGAEGELAPTQALPREGNFISVEIERDESNFHQKQDSITPVFPASDAVQAAAVTADAAAVATQGGTGLNGPAVSTGEGPAPSGTMPDAAQAAADQAAQMVADAPIAPDALAQPAAPDLSELSVSTDNDTPSITPVAAPVTTPVAGEPGAGRDLDPLADLNNLSALTDAAARAVAAVASEAAALADLPDSVSGNSAASVKTDTPAAPTLASAPTPALAETGVHTDDAQRFDALNSLTRRFTKEGSSGADEAAADNAIGAGAIDLDQIERDLERELRASMEQEERKLARQLNKIIETSADGAVEVTPVAGAAAAASVGGTFEAADSRDSTSGVNRLKKTALSSALDAANAKPHLTIDFEPSDSLDKVDTMKVSVNHDMSGNGIMSVPDAAAKAAVAALVSGSETPTIQEGAHGNGPVVDMIYDPEYVRKCQDEKPFGINIDTLDKAHTFIEAGVSLTEISAKTGLSEDELRLLYEVDENGKIINSPEKFKQEQADLELAAEADDAVLPVESAATAAGGATASSDAASATNSADTADGIADMADSAFKSTASAASDSGDSNSAADESSSSGTTRKGRGRTELKSDNPVEALDQDERRVIASMMKDKTDPFALSAEVSAGITENSSTAMVVAGVDSAAAADVGLDGTADSDGSKSDGNLSDAERAAQEALAQGGIDALVVDPDELNLEAIDRLADTIIQENRKKDKARKKAKRAAQKKNSTVVAATGAAARSSYSQSSDLSAALQQKTDDNDPLNVLSQYRNKPAAAATAAATAAAAAAAAASSIPARAGAGAPSDNVLDRDNADYQHDLADDIAHALDAEEDSVTLAGRSRTRKKAAPAQAPAQAAAAQASAQAARPESIRSGRAASTSRARRGDRIEPVSRDDDIYLGRPLGLSPTGAAGTGGGAGAGGLAGHMGLPPQSSGRGLDAMLGHSSAQSAAAIGTGAIGAGVGAGVGAGAVGGSGRGSRMTVDMALSQMEQVPAPRAAPLSLGAMDMPSGPSNATTNFSAVTAMNPGMADMLNAPMGLGDMGDMPGNVAPGVGTLAPDEDPADILNQVVKGGLNSVSALSQDQLDTLSELQTAVATGTNGAPAAPGAGGRQQHFANYQARNAYGIKRR